MKCLSARVHRKDSAGNPPAINVAAELVCDDAVDFDPLIEPAERTSEDEWGVARLLGMDEAPTGMLAAQQLAKLKAARSLRDAVLARRPHRVVRPASTARGSRVNREGGGHLCMSILGHPSSKAEAIFDLNFYDTWRADLSFDVRGFGTGLLPFLSLVHESDLVPDYLPRQSGLPHLERLDRVQTWEINDYAYVSWLSAVHARDFPACSPAITPSTATVFSLPPSRSIALYAPLARCLGATTCTTSPYSTIWTLPKTPASSDMR